MYNWDEIDAKFEQFKQSNECESYPQHVKDMLYNFRPWRFYTDTQIHKCVMRVLGIIRKEDNENKFQLIVVTLPLHTEKLSVSKLSLDEVRMIDEWDDDQKLLIKTHPNGHLFKEPIGFMYIQHALDKLGEDMFYDMNENEEKKTM
jgi:hypothetical protein